MLWLRAVCAAATCPHIVSVWVHILDTFPPNYHHVARETDPPSVVCESYLTHPWLSQCHVDNACDTGTVTAVPQPYSGPTSPAHTLCCTKVVCQTGVGRGAVRLLLLGQSAPASLMHTCDDGRLLAASSVGYLLAAEPACGISLFDMLACLLLAIGLTGIKAVAGDMHLGSQSCSCR